MNTERSNTAVLCFNCGNEYLYHERCACGKGGGTIKFHGPDCTNCKFGFPNKFGNGDVFCDLKTEGTTGVGYFCALWQESNFSKQKNG